VSLKGQLFSKEVQGKKRRTQVCKTPKWDLLRIGGCGKRREVVEKTGERKEGRENRRLLKATQIEREGECP